MNVKAPTIPLQTMTTSMERRWV